MKKKLSAIVLSIVALTLFGCAASSSENKVEEYANSEDVQEEIASVAESMSEYYSSIQLTAEDNTVIYTYVFVDALDSADFDTTALDEQLLLSADSTIEQIESDTDTEGVSLRYIYKDADGTVLFDKTYE